MFFKGKEIVNANPETFIILEENYSKDNVNVYFQNKMIEDANPKTFQLTVSINQLLGLLPFCLTPLMSLSKQICVLNK